MKNFKLSKVEITPFEIRDYLGLVKRDADGNVTDVKYPRYSMFKSRIIKTALDDIKRVCDAGQIDFYFDIKEVRPRGKKTGEPSYIEFVKVAQQEKASRDHRKASEKRLCKALCDIYPTLDEDRMMAVFKDVPEDLWNDFKAYVYHGVPKAVEKPHRWSGTMEDFVFYIMEQWIKHHSANTESQNQSIEIDEVEEAKPGEKEWDAFLKAYRGAFANNIYNFRFYRFENDTVHVTGPRDMYVSFQGAIADNPKEETLAFFRQLRECYGREVKFRIICN